MTSNWEQISFPVPMKRYDFIQKGSNLHKSGYSEYGQKLQSIILVELRSSRWKKTTNIGKMKIIIRTMKRLLNETLKR